MLFVALTFKGDILELKKVVFWLLLITAKEFVCFIKRKKNSHKSSIFSQILLAWVFCGLRIPS